MCIRLFLMGYLTYCLYYVMHHLVVPLGQISLSMQVNHNALCWFFFLVCIHCTQF